MKIWTTLNLVRKNLQKPCKPAAEIYIASLRIWINSPKDFIKEQRINYAAKLLLTTTLTIQEIMYRTAFTNRSHFYKEFGKRYNQTPKEYRESNKYKDDSLN